jgi:two-component system response regulator FixJ
MNLTPLVYIVEDDAGMRDALTLLFQGAGFDARSYPSAETFLAEVDRSQPVCLVADVRLPAMDGIALYRHLANLGCEPATVVLTGHGDISMAVAALKEGVVDFVEKPFDPSMLLDSVRDAWQRAVVSQERKAKTADIEARLSTLTTREAEVLALLVDGLPNKVIAFRLGMSVRTAEHHRARIMEKMNARSLSQLVKVWLAIRERGSIIGVSEIDG